MRRSLSLQHTARKSDGGDHDTNTLSPPHTSTPTTLVSKAFVRSGPLCFFCFCLLVRCPFPPFFLFLIFDNESGIGGD